MFPRLDFGPLWRNEMEYMRDDPCSLSDMG